MPENKVCTRCVMDTTDKFITFDEQGVCSHCHAYETIVKEWDLDNLIKNKKFESTIQKIKEDGTGKDFDCIVGLSGGVDSSFIAWLCKKNGLRPICVHLDNGWNSELAVANIHSIVDRLGFDLYTHVIDWEEFKDLQRSFFKANVVDIELLSDHAIFGVIMDLAKKHNIKYILSGANIATEAIMPKSWVHRKQDLANIKSIQKQFGTRKIKSFPQVSTIEHVCSMYVLGYSVLKPLNKIEYNKKAAKEILIKELGWRDYGGKHYESIFTKFYQAYILPNKFNIDKRKAHLSTLINSNQMTKEEALEELKKPLYNNQDLESDTEYVCKKLGFTRQEFQDYMKAPARSHYEFDSDQWIFDLLVKIKNFLGKKTHLQ